MKLVVTNGESQTLQAAYCNGGFDVVPSGKAGLYLVRPRTKFIRELVLKFEGSAKELYNAIIEHVRTYG
jgi:hypothetical protein